MAQPHRKPIFGKEVAVNAKKMKMGDPGLGNDSNETRIAVPAVQVSAGLTKPKSRGKNWKTLLDCLQKNNGTIRLSSKTFDEDSDNSEEEEKSDSDSDEDKENSDPGGKTFSNVFGDMSSSTLDTSDLFPTMEPDDLNITGSILFASADDKQRFLHSVAQDGKKYLRRIMLLKAGCFGGVLNEELDENGTYNNNIKASSDNVNGDTTVPLCFFDNYLSDFN
ncbi:uncharacterized protein LOC115632982 [Scaptodrosophila lebanonensis]|uniref:Uncharacterized protein LOC115632982 n=1 Tax=Drosophila lebanonensis TaxID=7225 RepID=A0A6J2UCQ2_DROLE|nr:uncharacterized protein LOC115632982 [Scaptodrosophila lebanonensis]